MANNEWLEYTVKVAVAGEYTIDIRVASLYSAGQFHLEFDGVNKTGPITVPGTTTDWQDWVTVSATATLSAGTQIMRFVNADSSVEYNINYFDFEPPMTTVPNVVGLSKISGYSAIIAQGLTLGTTTYIYSETVPVNHIISQSPADGTSVVVGSSVDTEISGFRGDLDNDGDVDLVDLQTMTGEWLTAGTLADIEPIGGDGWVDFSDFSVLASDWQKSL
jgi:hypothetical protein